MIELAELQERRQRSDQHPRFLRQHVDEIERQRLARIIHEGWERVSQKGAAGAPKPLVSCRVLVSRHHPYEHRRRTRRVE
jgi:hypothetical protein